MIAGITSATVLTSAQQKLARLRQALDDVGQLNGWVSAQSDADLIAIGFTQADTTAIKSACADASKLNDLYNGGGLGSYTLPYTFAASQRQIIGP